MKELCRLLKLPNGRLEFSSITNKDPNVLNEDKKYGFLKPKGGVLTFSITNRDGEISEKGVDRAVKYALKEWSLFVPITFKKVEANGDIRIEFHNEAEDSVLTPNTLAYMYYPLGGQTNGLCVVNTRFYWSNSGKGINMHKIDPIHYPDNTKIKGKSWDLDQVLRHEFGHGVFGLPHDVNKDNIMSGNYGVMKEHLSDDDVLRARTKAGTRITEKTSYLKRWLEYLKIASDRDL